MRGREREDGARGFGAKLTPALGPWEPFAHPVTPVKGLYLSGQDVLSAGVVGALMGGFMTTSAMLGRDAMKLMRLVKEWRPSAGKAS